VTNTSSSLSSYDRIEDVFSPPRDPRNLKFIPNAVLKSSLSNLYESFLSMATYINYRD
jgi:hypothetical protein